MNKIFLCLLVLMLTTSAYAQSDTAATLKHAARHGEPEAIMALVEYYRAQGSDEEKDYFIEYGLLQLKAQADIGNAEAAKALATIYAQGKWVAANEETQKFWLKRASALGNYKAFLRITKNNSSDGNAKDRNEEIIKKLHGYAKSGIASAWFELGQHYSGIHGASPNIGRAIHAYREAAKRNNSNGMTALAQLLLINTHTTDDAEAISWMQKAAEQGEAEAQYAMALIHLHGSYKQPRSNRRYRTFIKQAAEGGIADAQYRVAIDSFRQDKKMAMRYVGLAASQQHVPAKAQLKQWKYKQ